ncbi:hypothetical protein [Shimia sp. FJ5]|uniref:hypothetical protein n=1 Tax=Shimia sp. FJ5 TaxID=3079054 RepID=UPI00260C79E7|nr:hypothetical protein [Shimia sp. FJ5]MDV4145525.1 hypothetical protein [Shimia sp. FJ5]
MSRTKVEITNHSGAGTVIVARFETSAETAGNLMLAGGSSQIFEKFDRLTITAANEGVPGRLRLLNHDAADVVLRHMTKSGNVDEDRIPGNGFADVVVAGGDQIFLSEALPDLIFPERPILHMAILRPQPGPIFAPNQKPAGFYVDLAWHHPDEGSDRLLGFNLYRAVYKGNYPMGQHPLNGAPQIGTSAQVEDVIPPYPYNHRYAIMAVSRDGIESLYSNVRILDSNTRTDLFDAGFICL